jgi:hypothetical protein
VIEAWDADLHGHNEFLGECVVAHGESDLWSHSSRSLFADSKNESEGSKADDWGGDSGHSRDVDGTPVDSGDDDHEEEHHNPRPGVWIRTMALKPQVTQYDTHGVR